MNEEKENNEKLQALILAGGASHGAYHVGVIRALLEGNVGKLNPTVGQQGIHCKKLDPKIIAGISAGAFNGAVLMSQLEAGNMSAADYLKDVWLSQLAESKKRQGNGVLRFRGDPSELFNPKGLTRGPLKPLRWAMGDTTVLMREAVGRGLGFQKSNKPLLKRLTELVNLSSFVSMKPFEKSIRKHVNFDLLHIDAKLPKESQKKRRTFIAGTVGWEDGVMRYFTNRPLPPGVETPKRYLNPDGKPLYVDGKFSELGRKIILASAAVPGIFPLVKLDDEKFCDGAAIENTPFSCALKFDAEILHVVTSVPPVDSIPTRELPNTFDTLYRFIVTREAKTIRDDLDNAKKINEYVTIAGSLADARRQRVELKQQLADARRQLEELKQRLPDLEASTEVESMARDRSVAAFPTTDANEEIIADFIQKFAETEAESKTVARATPDDTPTSKKKRKKKVEIHVYRPQESLGGILSLLRFDRKFLARMIDQGYQDALRHNCEKNRCLLVMPNPLSQNP